MRICFDWQAIHKGLVSEGESRSTAAWTCAAEIRQDIVSQGIQSDQLFGKAPEICKRYGLGRETFLEATRLLENWGVARMRRGVNGGLVVANAYHVSPALKLARYFRLRGLSPSQVREARAVIDLAVRFCEEQRTGRNLSFHDEFRRLVSLPQPFSAQLKTSYLNGENPLQKCLQLFVDAIDTVEAQLAANAELPADGGARAASLASHVAHLLASEMAGLDREDRSLPRSEASITANLGVSRQVTRQAMRILQDEGLLQCRRGRGGGVNILTDHPAPVLHLLAASYRSAMLASEDFLPLLSAISRANRVLCAMRASDRDFARMAMLTDEQKHNDAASYIERMKLEWEIIDNPVLSLLEQSVAAYRATLAGETITTGFGDLQYIAECSVDQLHAMRDRNYPLADSLMQNIEGEIAVIMQTF